MPRTILTVLVGSGEGAETDHFQLLQEQDARAEAARAGLNAEIVFAPGFDHLRVIRGRVRGAGAPVDAVLVEAASISSAELILKELAGGLGLVLLNIEPPGLETHARHWGTRFPFGTVSTHHRRIGEIQGRQVTGLLRQGGEVLCVTGPEKSSAAVERMAGLRASLGGGVTVYTTEAGQWTEAAGGAAFDSWYGLFRSRSFKVDVVAAQSDELAMGVRAACERIANGAHRDMLTRARFLGVDACPGYGAKLVDAGTLAASVTTPANTGEAIRQLRQFWDSGRPLPLRALTEPRAYPLSSASSA
jgi:ABC-type sugar transport system substrate-binding protein